MRKAGALRNGMERGKGSIYHAVPSEGYGDAFPALCGAQPAIQWSASDKSVVTCPRCIRLVAPYLMAEPLNADKQP